MVNAKKGEKVILKGFTGIKLGVFDVVAATKKTVTINKRNGDELIFDRKTGKQMNVEEGKEKYANSVMDDDGSYVAPTRSGSAKKSSKKTAAKKSAPAPVEDDEDEEADEDEDEEEEPKPAKKPSSKAAPAAKAPKKGKKAAPVVEDDDDEDDDDDDEFEEIDD